VEHEPQQTPTWVSYSTCLGEIQLFASPLLPVWSNLSVNSVNIDRTEMSNMNLSCNLRSVIPWRLCLFYKPKAVSWSIELVNSVTSDSVNSFHFTMCTFASMCFPIELVPCSDGWRRTWCETIHMMPWQLVSSIPRWPLNCQEGACYEWFRVIGRFEPASIEAHWVSNMICKVWSLKSGIRTHSFLEYSITSSNEVFEEFESAIAIGIWKWRNSTWETVKSYVIVK